MPFVNFRKKFRFFSFDFRQNFEVRNVTENTQNQIFLMSYPKNFFLQNLHFGPIRWVPRRFFKISIIYSQNLYLNLVFLYNRTLSIRGTNFIACWAYAEPISSHAEHARKCLKVEYLGRVEYNFQKSRVTGPRDHKVSVSAKKSKKFHACVPFITLPILENVRRLRYLHDGPALMLKLYFILVSVSQLFIFTLLYSI